MTARDILSPGKTAVEHMPSRMVDASTPLLEVLPLLTDAPDRQLGVADGTVSLGVIDERSLLDGLGRMIAPRDDSSIITVECPVSSFSASGIARAVEDSDAQLVDLLSQPSDRGKLKVTLRVRHTDPTEAVLSLERHGFEVVDSHGAESSSRYAEVALDRLLSLQSFLNV